MGSCGRHTEFRDHLACATNTPPLDVSLTTTTRCARSCIQRRLCCCQPRHWHAIWRATHIVEAALFEEFDRRGVAAVFAANAYFESLFLVFGDFAALSRNIAAEPISPISPLSLSRSVFCVSPTDTGSFLVCS